MKILQINASYKPAFIYGGPTMSVSKLSEEVAKAGCTLNVYTTTANGTDELPIMPNITKSVDGVEVSYFKRITKDHSHLSPALLRALWRNAGQYDVIHIHAWWNLVSVLSALVAQLKRVPVVISPRGTLSDYSFDYKNSLIKKLLHNWLGRPLLNRSFIHATSPAEQQSLQQIIKPRHIFDIPNFVKIASSAKTKLKEDSIFKLLFFSRIDEKKGLDILLHALALLKIPYHLTIAGNGDDNYISFLKNIAHYNNTERYISWIGFRHDDKFDILAGHDLMILPSHNENFGNVVIESLSAGTPVLLSEGVGLAGYVTKNNMGWVCQANPQSVAGVIQDIAINQKNKLQQISAYAPGLIHADFDENKLVQRYIGMYQHIIKSKRP
ncbi:XrtY-associated glycosyltransferase XYAG1 [Mucilaginibacter panaciglaebae]|uniref:Glycosyltransferase n=1 Tax=Mucilaginibacter panaciglaebae TaxID=502331 RepID=A0ABP7WPF5_9SPHI